MKKFIQIISLLLMLLLLTSTNKAQSWQPLGSNDDNQPTFSSASNITAKANHAGIVYMAYRDVNDYLRVRKNNGTQWVDVGGDISLGAPGIPSLAFDTADIPYIAFPDYGFYQGCVSVKKFVGGSWQQVGTSCFSTASPDNVHIAISSKDSVFVLFRDGTTNKTNLKKYSGTVNWNTVGIVDFSGVATASCDLAIDATDSIYVAYANSSTNKISVQKFSNNNWSLVGNADFSIGTTSAIKMTTDANNNVFVGYANNAAGNQPVVMKWNGTSWNTLGTMQTASAPFDGNAIVLMVANGQPTFAYAEFYNGSISVQQYNGSTWNFLGTKYLTPLNYGTGFLGATSDNSGNVSIMYRDAANQTKVTAKKFIGGIWTDFETRGLATGYMTDVRTFVDYNGIPYICYSDVTNGYKACVKKSVGGNWVDVGVNGFSTDRANNISLAFDKNSVPYICYRDESVGGTTVQKFNGTTWVTVGVKDITGRTAFVPYISMDTATSTPYVISQDDNGHFYRAVVEKFDGTNWVAVGSTPNFSVGRIFNPKIVITTTGVPYVTYADEDLGSQAIVKTFDGTNWVNAGTGIISAFGNTDYNVITLGKNDTLYVAYKDNQATYKAIVKKFDGTNWSQVGGNIGIGGTKYLSLVTNANGVPYIAYEDDGDASKAYVKKYNKNANSWDDIAMANGGITAGRADWVSLASNKTNNTFYFAYAYGDVYAKTIGLSITATAGAGGTITPSGSTDVASGTNKSFTITANAGFCIQDVLVDGVSIGAATTYTFTNVTVSHSISASFVAQVTPSVTIVASPSNHICAGANVVFTATATNGGSSPTYNFLVNGNSVQNSSSNTFSSSSLNNSDDVSCILTANNFCQTKATDNSNTIRMTVDVSVTPSISLVANNNNVCAGTNITFTATATNGGSSPSYNFMVNGNSVQNSNSNTFSSSSLNNNDVVGCTLTANNTCQTAPTAMSNNVNMNLIAYLTPSVTIGSNSGLNICSGSNVVFTATPVNGGSSPTFNFLLNGNSVQSGSSNTFNVSSLNNNDDISCTIISNNVCQTTNNANSNNLVMTLTANATPTISIQSNAGNTICAGTNVVFTATPVNGGNAPIYQWKKNGANVGNNSNIYTTNGLVNNDSVWCVLTSNSVCVITPTAISNKIKFTVNPLPTDISAILGNTTSCSIGTINNLTDATNGGVWSSNNTNVATVNNTGKVSSVSNGVSTISYTVTNVYGCSASVSTIFTVAAVTVAQVTGLNNLCVGNSTTYNCVTPNGVWSTAGRANITNTGLATAISAGNTSIIYTVTNVNGCSSNSFLPITIAALPPVPSIAFAPGTTNVSGSGGYCKNRTFTLVGSPSNGVWTKTGVITINPSGINSTSTNVTTGNIAGATSATYTITDANGCSNSRTINTNIVACANKGIKDAQLAISNEQIVVYPNPTHSTINFRINSQINSGSIVITDLYGKQIKQQSLSIGTNIIDVSSFAKGIYFVSIITDNSKQTQKIIVE